MSRQRSNRLKVASVLRAELADSPREVLRFLCCVVADVAACEHALGERAALSRVEVYERRLAALQLSQRERWQKERLSS